MTHTAYAYVANVNILEVLCAYACAHLTSENQAFFIVKITIEDRSRWNVYQLIQAARDFQRTSNTAQSCYSMIKWPTKADRFDK